MEEQGVVVAGFGGQGVLFAGLVLAHGALRADLNVAWIPFYGPEMRGGTAGCTVIISEEEVGSPIVSQPTAVIVMNEPSMAKWAPRVRPSGTLVVNSSLIAMEIEREDIQVVRVPASEIAAELGNDRMANMVAVGALIRSAEVLPMEIVEEAIAETLGPGKEKLVGPNCEALRRGAAVVEASLAPAS